MTTLAERKSQIQEALRTNQVYLESAILAIYSRQTHQEQSLEATLTRNDIGFNGADAQILSSFAQWIERSRRVAGERLTERQAALATRKMQKYWRQLDEVCPVATAGITDAEAAAYEQVVMDVARRADAALAAHLENAVVAGRPATPPSTMQVQVNMVGEFRPMPFSRTGFRIVTEASSLLIAVGAQPSYLRIRTAAGTYDFEAAGTKVDREGDLVAWIYTATDVNDREWELHLLND